MYDKKQLTHTILAISPIRIYIVYIHDTYYIHAIYICLGTRKSDTYYRSTISHSLDHQKKCPLAEEISAKDSYDVQYFRGGGDFRLHVPVMTLAALVATRVGVVATGQERYKKCHKHSYVIIAII